MVPGRRDRAGNRAAPRVAGGTSAGACPPRARRAGAVRPRARPGDRRGGPRATACRCDHGRLYDRLARLLPTQFEQIVFLARIERGLIAPDTAPLADRILGLARLAEVDPDLCRRVSMLLDDRAPWTRRPASPTMGCSGGTRRKPIRRAPRKAGMDRFRRRYRAWRQGE